MNVLQALALGLVQGIAEILPVSSDGHLAVLQHLLHTSESTRLALTSVLHLGTGLALVVFFWRPVADICQGAFGREAGRRRESWRVILTIALATVPAVLAGLLFEERVAGLTGNMVVVGACLGFNGVLLFATRYLRERGRSPTLVSGLVIGLAQVLALLPGVSRSGTTVACGLALGLAGPAAFEFSFLLAIPATLGAGLYELLKLEPGALQPGPVAIGAVVALLAGLAALWLLRRVVARGRLFVFGVYCLAAAVAVLAFVR